MTPRTFVYTLAVLSLPVIWSYGSTLSAAQDRWNADPQYSHGWIVPVFALYLLYHRRELLDPGRWPKGKVLEPSLWCLPFLAAAVLLRYMEVRYSFHGFDALSMVPMFLGLMLAVGGWPAYRWGWPACGFLVFMVPLPYFLHTAMSTQLQAAATSMSTYLLQTLGIPAVAEGTQIMINESRISVVEACSGLGMVVTFAALSVAAVLLIRSPWWVKLGLILGAVPVSLICNVVRITVMGLVKYAGFSAATVDTVHDYVGFAMILLGCGLIFVELAVLERIVITQESSRAGDDPLTLPFGVAMNARATS